MEFDIIVIGAGLGGLTAAACAAKEGKKVLVLEKGITPGGAASSFIRGRFEFEASLHTLCGYSKSQGVGDVRIILDELGIDNLIEWCQPDSAFRVITKSKSGEKLDVTLPFGAEKFTDALESYVPGCKSYIEQLFDIAKTSIEAMNYLCSTDEKINMNFAKKLHKEYPAFVRTAPYSVNEVFDAMGIQQKAREILTSIWCYWGVDCDRLSFTEYIIKLYTYIVLGAFIPKNRSFDISMALASFIENNNSEIRYNTTVTKILFENGEAKGIILKNGEKILCKHIIANCSPTTVYSKMMKSSDVPLTATKRTNARTFGARGASVYLGLNRSPEELGIKDYNVIITETADTSVQYDLMRTQGSNNTCIASCLNKALPECSPNGTTILTLTTIFTENCWANVEPENYFNEKDNFAKRVISLYEETTGVKIRDYIEEMEIATPLTFARYLNTPQGVILGYLPDSWDSMLSRFMTEKSDSDTKGLRFCGGWGTQLSGMASAITSGRNTAYFTLADISAEPQTENKEDTK
ncbi:MAG: NAD(P)/FAD-dependent oxidoreductase [Clostridia bacterium]|nr:NAD(P)/FAD-dependent oxidoreductase [Clostridia bacterium]